MTDPNAINPTLMQGWESLKQRTTTIVVALVLVLATLGSSAGRERLVAWGNLAGEALSPRPVKSLYSSKLTELTLEQQRVVRWIAKRHRVSGGAVEQLVDAGFKAAANFRLDPYLLLAVISIESGFNPLAESSAGAVGLMQIMPKAHLDRLKAFGGPKQALDPWVNLQVGASILREYIDRFGSEQMGLQAYVGSLNQPSEYPSRVLRVRALMAAAAAGRVLA
jgi:soluble lytic murein transglycosylase-like protein